MAPSENISQRTGRVAKNTILLYFRMLLMMIIGLFTSRVILKTLGVVDYGTYNAVAGVVTMFTFLSNSISQAISRYITFELGKGEENLAKLKKIFSSSLVIQALMSLSLVILSETVGLWFLYNKMDIPAERLEAAFWVLQAAIVTLILNLLAVPYNATIIAHEKMSAFAYISILEALGKLSVAIVLVLLPFDKLIGYSLLMCLVAFIVRGTYATYCKRHFEESKVSFFQKGLLEKQTLKEMSSFAGWNFFGSSAFVLNTQGMNILTNVFWGVTVNAARGIATQVEGIVKQFVSNFMTALNPQITKSWAAGEKQYCFELVRKGGKFCFLILLFFAIPFVFEADILLDLWLVNVPEHAALFTRLVIFGIMADMVCNSLLTLELAYGKIRGYYLVTGAIAYLALPITWSLVKWGGCEEWTPYAVFIAIYILVDVAKLVIVHRQTGFESGRFLKEVVLKGCLVAILSGILPYLLYRTMDQTILRLLLVLAASSLSIIVFSWTLALTKTEKEFILQKAREILSAKSR